MVVKTLQCIIILTIMCIIWNCFSYMYSNKWCMNRCDTQENYYLKQHGKWNLLAVQTTLLGIVQISPWASDCLFWTLAKHVQKLLYILSSIQIILKVCFGMMWSQQLQCFSSPCIHIACINMLVQEWCFNRCSYIIICMHSIHICNY